MRNDGQDSSGADKEPTAETSDSDHDDVSFSGEALVFVRRAIPMSVVQFGIYFIFPATISAVGLMLGKEHLAAITIASMTAKSTCVAIAAGVASAADTLMPRALATQNYFEVGRLAIRGFVIALLIFVVPVSLLTTCMDPLFLLLGQNPTVSHLAVQWIRIFVGGAPYSVLIRLCQRFLGSQGILWPIAIATNAGAFIIYPVMIWLLISILGFEGSALALILGQLVQVALALLILRFRPVYHPQTWGGLSAKTIKEALELEPTMLYLRLSVGGVLSFAEWFFWELSTLIIGSMGVIPLDVHAIPSNVIPLITELALGGSIALSHRVGHIISSNTAKARKVVAISLGIAACAACVVAAAFFGLGGWIVRLFTTNQEVILGCQDIWGDVCWVLLLRFIYIINAGIMRGLGLQWRLFVIIVLVMWAGCLPTIILVGLVNSGGVTAVWRVLPFFYLALNVLLILCHTTSNWHTINTRLIEGNKTIRTAEDVATEETRLVSPIDTIASMPHR